MARRTFGAGRPGRSATVSCSEVLPAAVVARVYELVDLGALVSLSRSRDGGALAVTVTWDGEWEREWFRDAGAAQLQLDEWAGVIEDAARDAGNPPAASQRARKRR